MKVKVGFPVYTWIVNRWFIPTIAGFRQPPKFVILKSKPCFQGSLGKITSTGRLATWRWKGDEATRITYESPCLTFYVNKRSLPPTPPQPRAPPLPAVFCHPSSLRVSALLASWRCSIDYTRKKNLQNICKTETRPPPTPCVTGSLEKFANPWRGHHRYHSCLLWMIIQRNFWR